MQLFTKVIYPAVEVGIIGHHPGDHFAWQGILRKPAKVDKNDRVSIRDDMIDMIWNLMVEKSSKIGGVSFTSWIVSRIWTKENYSSASFCLVHNYW